MSTVTAELIQKVTELRQKIFDKTITMEEMREGIKFLRADRQRAIESRPKESKARSATRQARSAEELLADFES